MRASVTILWLRTGKGSPAVAEFENEILPGRILTWLENLRYINTSKIILMESCLGLSVNEFYVRGRVLHSRRSSE